MSHCSTVLDSVTSNSRTHTSRIPLSPLIFFNPLRRDHPVSGTDELVVLREPNTPHSAYR